MPLEMRAHNHQPLIAIQLAKKWMGIEVVSQPSIGRCRKLQGAVPNGLELAKQLLVAPLALWLHRLRRLRARLAVLNGADQLVFSSLPRAALARIGRCFERLFDSGKDSAFGNGQVLQVFGHRPSVGSRVVVKLLRREAAGYA